MLTISRPDSIMDLINSLLMFRQVRASQATLDPLKRLLVPNTRRKIMILILTSAIQITNPSSNKSSRSRPSRSPCLPSNPQLVIKVVQISLTCWARPIAICPLSPSKIRVKMHWISSMISILVHPSRQLLLQPR